MNGTQPSNAAYPDQHEERPGRRRQWMRLAGLVLMLPIGLILLLVLFLLFGGKGNLSGWWFIIAIALFLVLLVARISFRRARRRDWMQRRQGQGGPMRILQERYARGEITKEQFDQMSRDLQPRRFR